MRRKKIWRYYCDFCKKSNCSAASISRHEKRCTKNPDRYCGMCKAHDAKQKPMDELLAILASITVVEKDEGGWLDYSLVGDMDAALSTLIDETENCPACILAALRQKGIPIPLTKFNFTEAVKEFWGYVNEVNRADAEYGVYDY